MTTTPINYELLSVMFDKQTLLNKAAEINNKEIIENVLNSITDYEKELNNVETIIINLFDNNQIEIVSTLLTKITLVNKNNIINQIIKTKRIELIKLLLDNGADINYKDSSNTSFLMKAIDSYYGVDVELVKMLIERGADVNVVNMFGSNALTYSCSRNAITSVGILLDTGININHRKLEDGFTALMIATENNFEQCIKLLLEKGADRDIKNAGGKTAKDLAKDKCRYLFDKIELPHYGLCSNKERLDINLPSMKTIKQNNQYYYVFPLEIIDNKNHKLPSKQQKVLEYLVDDDTMEGVYWL